MANIVYIDQNMKQAYNQCKRNAEDTKTRATRMVETAYQNDMVMCGATMVTTGEGKFARTKVVDPAYATERRPVYVSDSSLDASHARVEAAQKFVRNPPAGATKTEGKSGETFIL